MQTDPFTTLIQILSSRAADSSTRAAFTFINKAVTYGELWRRINQFAAHLLETGIKRNERVIIALPNGPEFFYAFYGVQRAGAIAVPVFPGAGAGRIISLAELCGAKRIVVPSDTPASRLTAFREAVSNRVFSLVRGTDSAGAEPHSDYPVISPSQVAFLQYTSGSTGNPKGVIITHANLMTNIRQLIAGMEISARDIFVSWLPVYHDMGLILKTMVPFYLRAELHLLPTDLRDVRPWLDLIQTRKATFTAAPDFAYRLCLRRVNSGDYDLSSLRVALNAAEPVRASTIRDFENKFGLKNVMVAGYGLAEATVGVSMWKPQTPNRVDARGRVSVGRPFPDVDVAIVTNMECLPHGQTGEIVIKSPANTQGYFNNPGANADLFWRDGYLHTGDLGYLDEDGCLYITGRVKNIIKRSGETISPQEIEELIDKQPGVRFSAAIGVDRGTEEGEQVLIFAEMRNGEKMSENSLHESAVQMVAGVYEYQGFRPARIFLLKPKGIPLTDNGKIQHARLRALYLDGILQRQGVILYPGD